MSRDDHVRVAVAAVRGADLSRTDRARAVLCVVAEVCRCDVGELLSRAKHGDLLLARRVAGIALRDGCGLTWREAAGVLHRNDTYKETMTYARVARRKWLAGEAPELTPLIADVLEIAAQRDLLSPYQADRLAASVKEARRADAKGEQAA